MASYTISTNARQEAALSAIVARENATRAQRTPPEPPLTNNEYLLQRVVDLLRSYVGQKDRDDVLQTLTPAQRDALGIA